MPSRFVLRVTRFGRFVDARRGLPTFGVENKANVALGEHAGRRRTETPFGSAIAARQRKHHPHCSGPSYASESWRERFASKPRSPLKPSPSCRGRHPRRIGPISRNGAVGAVAVQTRANNLLVRVVGANQPTAGRRVRGQRMQRPIQHREGRFSQAQVSHETGELQCGRWSMRSGLPRQRSWPATPGRTLEAYRHDLRISSSGPKMWRCRCSRPPALTSGCTGRNSKRGAWQRRRSTGGSPRGVGRSRRAASTRLARDLRVLGRHRRRLGGRRSHHRIRRRRVPLR